MLCKFCGNQIDPTSRLCPECGERQADRCDGNGFWDILSQKDQSAPMEKRVVVDTKKVADPTKQVRKTNMHKTAMRQRLALVLSLLCLLYALISSVALHMRMQILEKEMKTVTETLERQMEPAPYANTPVPLSEPVEVTITSTIVETVRLETEPESEQSSVAEEQATESFQDQSEYSEVEQRN